MNTTSFINQLINRLTYEGYQQLSIFPPFYDSNNSSVYPLLKEVGALLHFALIVDTDKLYQRKEIDKTVEFYNHLLHHSEYFVESGAVLVALVFCSACELPLNLSELPEEDYSPGKSIYFNYYGINNHELDYKTPKNQADIMGLDPVLNDVINIYSDNLGHDNISLAESESNYYDFPKGTFYLTFAIAIINIIVFVLMELSGGSTEIEVLIKFGAVQNTLVFIKGDYYRIFTSMFIHIGYMHLLQNSLSLYIYGSRVETAIGRFEMLIIYILSGLSAGFFSPLFSNSVTVMAGASGAIFGLLGAICVLTAMTKKPVGGLSPYLISMLAISGLGLGFVYPGVSNIAHISGFITGAIVSYPFIKKI